MKSAAAVTFKEFTSDGRTGENSLIGRQILKRLRKIAANFGGNRDTEFVGQAGCHVGFVNDHRNLQGMCSADNRNGNKSAF